MIVLTINKGIMHKIALVIINFRIEVQISENSGILL